MQGTNKYHKYFSPETIASLDKLWDEIGYSEEDKKIRLHQLVERIQNVHSDFIDETLRKCQNLQRETNEIKEKHIQKLKALNAPDEEIELVKNTEILGTIKSKYIDTLNNYNEFLDIYNQRVDEFKKYYIQIQSCFKKIGIIDTVPKCCNEEEEIQEQNKEDHKESEELDNVSNEYDSQSQNNDEAIEQNKTHIVSSYSNQDNTQNQGEFSEIGDEDLSKERLKRFENKANELQKEVDIRYGIFNDIRNKINKLQSDLCEVSPPEIEEMLNGNVYSDFVCDRLTDYQRYLTEIYDTRKNYVSEMAVEIVKLWDLLDVDETTRNQFLQTHSVFSQKNVQDCFDEAERLTQIRNSKLPEIIEKMKIEISRICDDLSYSEEQKQQIFEKCDNDNLGEGQEEVQYNEENKDMFINFDDDKSEEDEDEEEQKDHEEQEEDKQFVISEIEEEEEQNENDEKEEKEENMKIEEEEEEIEIGEIDNNDEKIDQIEQPSNESYDENKQTTPNEINEEYEENKKEDGQIPLPEFEENSEVTKNFVQIFNNYDCELYRLRKIHLVSQPIIDAIKLRQEMIEEYNKVTEEIKQNKETSNKPKNKETTSKPKKKAKNQNKNMAQTVPVKKNTDNPIRTDQLNGQIELRTIRIRPPNAQDKIYQEKVIRRYKTILPRLEKKLLITLIQFREENGEDFIWNQKPMINELKHIRVTQSEIRAQSKGPIGISGQSSKKNIASLNSIKYNANTKQRKSLQPSSQKIDANAKPKKTQRKSTIPTNPNLK